ncbi:hypothetical protein LKI01_14780 [Companilactobacillus paralimentarius]|nr:hypothetical protein LKI01_14780 [Companilactobacillus paralimentarius]
MSDAVESASVVAADTTEGVAVAANVPSTKALVIRFFLDIECFPLMNNLVIDYYLQNLVSIKPGFCNKN